MRTINWIPEVILSRSFVGVFFLEPPTRRQKVFLSQWCAKECVLQIRESKPLAIGWDFSQDYIGIGLSGGGGLQPHLWSGDLEPHTRFPPFPLQGGSRCYVVNSWGPIAHRQGIYLLEAVVLLELLFWGGIVSDLETNWGLRTMTTSPAQWACPGVPWSCT